jgi:flotillin
VNQAIEAGGESYFRYRQIEMLPQIAPAIADALAAARLITISSGDTGAAETTANNMVSVIQTVLAAQMVAKGGILDRDRSESNGVPVMERVSAPTPPRPSKPEEEPPLRKW